MTVSYIFLCLSFIWVVEIQDLFFWGVLVKTSTGKTIPHVKIYTLQKSNTREIVKEAQHAGHTSNILDTMYKLTAKSHIEYDKLLYLYKRDE